MMKVAVIGSGTMGAGIAYAAIVAGMSVNMYDNDSKALDRGYARIKDIGEMGIKRGKIKAEAWEAAFKNLTKVNDLRQAVEKCDLVIEAVLENLPLKQEIFKALDEAAPRQAVLASNTSSMSITEIAAATSRPDKVVGMHFFNPAPVMKLIEIIRGLVTSDETFQITKELSLKLGKTPLEANDFPGFISSRLIFSYMNEAIYALYEGMGKAEDIDAIMKMGANHPMGPLELADFVGLDTVLSVMSVLQEAFGDKYRPCPLLLKYVDAGYLGVKTGRGFYHYGGKR